MSELSQYHSKYQSKPDDEIARRAKEKMDELERVFSAVPLDTAGDIVRVAVMGCGDVRFVQWHRQIFARVLARPVEITTFDIDITHLQGEQRIVQHDCSLPLLGGPYDITFGHVVLPFLSPAKQLDMIQSGFDALAHDGIQIQVLDPNNYDLQSETLPGLSHVDLKKLELAAQQSGGSVTFVPLAIGQAVVIKKN